MLAPLGALWGVSWHHALHLQMQMIDKPKVNQTIWKAGAIQTAGATESPLAAASASRAEPGNAKIDIATHDEDIYDMTCRRMVLAYCCIGGPS
jgi:hypothetical protein